MSRVRAAPRPAAWRTHLMRLSAAPEHTNSASPSAGNGSRAATTTASDPAARPWTTDDAAKLYAIQNWGQGYFSVNAEGNVAVHPTRDAEKSIDLKHLVDELCG